MIFLIKRRIKLIILVLIIILGDQISKKIVVDNIDILLNRSLIIFKINYIENYGAAFNLFNGNSLFLSLVSIFSSIILVYLTFHKRDIKEFDRVGLSLILAGTIGNGTDRVIKGFVVDFINLQFINFPVFNIADISINIGFFLLLISIFNVKKI
tara:strand:- start:346 stop:807 length:462 start_codon:yes stop_codon:yes gene_type:complete